MGTGTGSIDLSTLNNLHGNLTQHFWFNSNAGAAYGTGVHMTLSSQAEFIANPTGQNILMNTDGISIRNGTIPLMVLDNDSLDFNVVTDLAQGTYSNVATFGTTGFKIGRTQNGQTRIEATPQGVDLISRNDNRDLTLAHFGYRENHDPSSNEKAPFYIFGERSYPDYSSGTTYHRGDVVLWNQNGYSYVCLNNNVTTEPNDDDNWSILGYQQWLYTLCEGYKTVAASSYAHAEGLETVSSGTASHAEGRKTVAGNYQSHAEGYGSRASGSASHAEGCETVADGFQSHAEGLKTVSSGTASHAEGWKTIVSGDYSHVEGKYNVEDTKEKYAHIIGNGTSEGARSNALTVDWNGTIRTDKDSMKTLWSGTWYMNADQTATLSEKVSEQLTGIVLVWSYYTNGAAQDYGWHTFFVPKGMVKLKNGVGYDIPLRRDKNAMFGTKYVYVYDDRLVGYASNVATGTANNVPYQNNKWVLRYVFGC